jgi:predicted enzyme related to lactoylglutathione lyase
LIRALAPIIAARERAWDAVREAAHMASADRGNFVWYEHLSKDTRATIAFYSDVVGWKTEPFGDGDYVMWVASQGPLGGVMGIPAEGTAQGMRPHWTAHVEVDDVDATAARAKQLGGKIYKEPTDIPTVGRFAVIGDPQGASLSIFTPASDMPLHDVSKPGEFCWNELVTTDAAAAFRFYSELFGWKVVEDMDMGPMGTYRVFGVGDKRLGGMMTIPKGNPMPPMWMFYTETSDLDGALDRARRKGAQVMNGPMDVPGGGRIAQLTDPHGAVFALHQSARK